MSISKVGHFQKCQKNAKLNSIVLIWHLVLWSIIHVDIFSWEKQKLSWKFWQKVNKEWPKKVKDLSEYKRHIGVYAFRKDTLINFASLQRSKNEISENLEGNRAIDNLIPIKMVKINWILRKPRYLWVENWLKQKLDTDSL